jgi:8-oxo-dGTP pyrophosphatase MutT (NUDIX family)
MDGSKTKLRRVYTQYAALPFRRRADGVTEVLLVTSKSSRRWIIPKGWPMTGIKPHRAARREALEEAGLVGRLEKGCLGSFHYQKRLRQGRAVTCEVHVFPLNVQRQRRRWREKKQRETRWFTTDAAVAAVRDPGLRRLIAEFAVADARQATAACSDQGWQPTWSASFEQKETERWQQVSIRAAVAQPERSRRCV